MEFFDIRKMPVSLWRNGAGETREICCFPPATRDFHWRASIATIASNGEFSSFPGVDRVITLLDKCELKALPLDGQKWYEIDDVQDLDIAETLFANSVIKLSRYQKRYGGYWRFPALLDYCYLVNPFFPTQRMRDEIKANFDVLLTEYPSGMSVNSLLIGKYFGVNPDYVCVGNGAAELIKSLMEYLPGTIGVIYPTFEEYPNRCNKQEVVVYIPSNQGRWNKA